METVELVNSINKVAPGRGLVAKIANKDFIKIVDTECGATWAAMLRSLFQQETWDCYTKFPEELLLLLGTAVPVFGNSKIKWPNGLWPQAYLDVDIGYMIVEEAMTLTNGERLKGWWVEPPEISGPRTVEYNLIAEKNDRYGRFCFWQPGKAGIRILKNSEVKKIEVISNENSN